MSDLSQIEATFQRQMAILAEQQNKNILSLQDVAAALTREQLQNVRGLNVIDQGNLISFAVPAFQITDPMVYGSSLLSNGPYTVLSLDLQDAKEVRFNAQFFETGPGQNCAFFCYLSTAQTASDQIPIIQFPLVGQFFYVTAISNVFVSFKAKVPCAGARKAFVVMSAGDGTDALADTSLPLTYQLLR